MSESNPFRFSTKYQDDETGLLYYGYRYYQPNTGRWLSRDPIGENGGENQYEFAMNDSVSYIDPDGAKSKKLPPIYTPPTPGKLAMCLARCGVMDIIGGAYEDKFEANRLCGKIKNHCETEGALPKPEDMAGAVDLKPGGNAWGRAAKCFVDCLGLTCQFDVEGEGLYAGGGRIFCNKATQRVDYSIPITLRLKLVPGGHVLTEQKKTNNGSCGTVAYSRCCCGE
jgi:RHS repeat-associated protein